MKPFAMGLLGLLISVCSFAQTPGPLSLSTTISCDQVAGDLWYEIGLVPFTSKDGYLIAIVLHDEKKQTSRLVMETSVYETKNNESLVFENANGSLRLVVDYKGPYLDKGMLSILKDGQNVMHELDCYKNGRITYDRISKPQPRISVGS
ncbi:hypothetical protein [Bdellovibrio sp. BCCA]|uniref:hypothetical protein n=1 Tax=Bdellovibrio sp. BCCA TaxID=3136281 RepID=UPI0030EFBAC0